jgi:hypothetical protein
MSAAPDKRELNFDSYIAERTKQFEGRVWVFERVHEWLTLPGASRFLLLTGDPGSGKTAIAARLVEFSRGVVTPPPTCTKFSVGFLSAVHFCVARAGNWIDPTSFARSISLQLAEHHQQFAVALKNAGERSVNIQVTQEVNQATTVKGVVIENLTLSGLNPQTAFTAAVVTPLEEIYRQGFDLPITIVVDGLDEALAYKSDITIVKLLSALDNIPPKVRFILTSRREAEVENEFLRAENFFLSSQEHDHANEEDMKLFVEKRLAGSTLAESAQVIAQKAEGNFQYATFLLNSLPAGSASSMAGLPAGLDSLYRESLGRVIGSRDWGHDYAPVMGLLSVARESLTDTQLRNFSGLKEREIGERLTDLRQFIEQTGPPRGYRLYHQSVIDFLELPDLNVSGGTVRNDYYLPPGEWHERVASYYFSNGEPSWFRWDSYGLRYTGTHLAAASRAESDGNRHALVRRLVNLVIDPRYRTRYLSDLDDVPALLHNFTEAVRCAALDYEGMLLLVQSALALIAFRDEELRPQALLDLAAAGQIERASRRLELFEIDEDWARAAQLTIAWLGARTNEKDARTLLSKVNPLPGPTKRLFDLVQAEVEKTPPPPSQFSLDPPLPEGDVATLVDWFGGKGGDPEMLQRIVNDSFLSRGLEMGAPTGYLAARDAPVLVAFAAAYPPDGDRYLRQYVAIHSGYQYVQYRNRSLWIVLDNVLRHPDPNWIREMMRELAATALSGSLLEFREALPLTVLGLQATAGKSGAKETLASARDQALNEAAQVPDEPNASLNVNMLTWRAGGGTAAPPEKGDDSWGAHRRRMAAHAQILARLEGNWVRANELSMGAANLKRGFAGFQVPVYMMLAETFLICNPTRPPIIETILDMSQQAAHNVQDASFCLRMTSRCNAMRQRWWGSLNLRDSVRVLVEKPRSPELAAQHRIGEDFRHREPVSLALSDEVRTADTLAALSKIYHRPIAEIQHMNPGVDTDQPLAPGTLVNIPDPGFATWIAARLSAELLVESSLADQERTELLQLLVPIALPNPTVLDLVLARLLLVVRPADAALLDALEGAAGPPIISPLAAFEAKLPS